MTCSKCRRDCDDSECISFFSTFDLFQGYWQINIYEKCKDNTILVCKFGTYRFEFMPFGLKNSCATLHGMMEDILVNVANDKCCVDDVVTYSATKESYIKYLENVYLLLLKHGICIRLEKSPFRRTRAKLLRISLVEDFP